MASTDALGVLDDRELPSDEFQKQWSSILIEDQIKDQLLGQAILNFTLRTKVSRATLPLHGLILLVGPPGTGKTSLARGLASRTAEAVKGIGRFRFIEVEPHALASAALGKSQRAVRELLGSTVAEAASAGPVIVLLDEVETLAADRTRVSLEANPIDVHRATDAVLAQLDHLAATHPQLLFVATSNFPKAVDSAFVSRADLVLEIPRPTPEGCRLILNDAVKALCGPYPNVERVFSDPLYAQAAKECAGLDGRQIRKLVVAACASSKESALDPGRLTADLLLATVRRAIAAVRPTEEHR